MNSFGGADWDVLQMEVEDNEFFELFGLQGQIFTCAQPTTCRLMCNLRWLIASWISDALFQFSLGNGQK